MKQLIAFGSGLLFNAFLISCSSSADQAVENDLDRLGTYLDSIKTAAPVYSNEAWKDIKTAYNNTVETATAEGKKLSDKASKKLEEVKAEYNTLKDDYEVHIREAEAKASADAYKTNIRQALFAGEDVGADMQFKFVTAKNALSVYDRFVTTVKENKEKYSREDWDEVKVLYEALDSRKNEIEKELSTSDNLKIAKLKVQFAAIKSVNRPLSKLKENEDAKKD